jgi:hypothetical protein
VLIVSGRRWPVRRPTSSRLAHLLEIREAWRRVQIRELFRLSLESLLYWTLDNLQATSSSIDALVRAFLDQTPRPAHITTAGEWIEWLSSQAAGPTELITRVRQALDAPPDGDLARSIATGLAFCLTDFLKGKGCEVVRDIWVVDRLNGACRVQQPACVINACPHCRD